MSLTLGLLAILAHLTLMLAAAPLAAGLEQTMAARLAGRAGCSPLLGYRALAGLLRKQPVVPESASPLFLAAPVLQLAALAAAALAVPSFSLATPTPPVADLVVIAGLLLLARLIAALAAFDTGAAGPGAAASQLLTMGAIGDAVFLVAIFTLALLRGETAPGLSVARDLAGFALVIVALSETAAGPFAGAFAGQFAGPAGPDPLAAEYGGRGLAVIGLARGLRLVLWMSLLGALFLPFGLAAPASGPGAWLAGFLAWAARLAVMTAGLACCQQFLPQAPAQAHPGWLGFAMLLALAAALFAALGEGPA